MRTMQCQLDRGAGWAIPRVQLVGQVGVVAGANSVQGHRRMIDRGHATLHALGHIGRVVEPALEAPGGDHVPISFSSRPITPFNHLAATAEDHAHVLRDPAG